MSNGLDADEKSVSLSSPVSLVMAKEAVAESPRGTPFTLKDQMIVFSVKLLYHTEKVNLLELFTCRKPAAKVEFGETRVMFCVDRHGELEEVKLVSCCAEDNERVERRTRTKAIKRDMVLLFWV